MKRFLLAAVALSLSAKAQESGNVQVDMGVPGAQMKVQIQTSTSKQTAAEPASTAPAAGRDCGTGNDSGCTMRRDGELPMDAETFTGFIDSLKGQPNEIERHEMAESTFKSNFLTAKQLGVILELFPNEITRLEVAKAAVARLVDPKHALGLSKKFQNSIQAAEFNEALNKQH